MPKPASTKSPRPRPGPRGAAPGATIDDLAAERNTPPLPPQPVFTIDLVEAEAGHRGRRRVAELEEQASHNARAAAEARRIALEQRQHLEEAARGRLAAEREISKLKREVHEATAEQQRLAARLSTALSAEPAGPAPADPPRGGAARSELTRTREIVEQQARLLDDRREQLAGALRDRDAARLEARLAVEGGERAKRNLAEATDILQRKAREETARIATGDVDSPDADENRTARVELEHRVIRLTEELEQLTTYAADLERAAEQQATAAELAEQHAVALQNTVAITTGERDTAQEQAAESRARLAAGTEARETAAARIHELEALLLASKGQRERAEASTGDRIDELTRRIADLDTSASTAHAGRDAAEARTGEIETLLSASTEALESATARIDALEALLADSTAKRDDVSTQVQELEAQLRGATEARDAEQARTESLTAELNGRLAEAEASVVVTTADRDAAQAHIADLESRLRVVETEEEGSAEHLVELESRLAQAESDRAAADARVEELIRAEADAHEALTRADATRALEHQGAQEQQDRLTARVAELEEMLLSSAPAPEATSNRSAVFEEFGQLAASKLDHEPSEHTTESPEPAEPVPVKVPVEAPVVDDIVEPRSDLRRSFLADLSELAVRPPET